VTWPKICCGVRPPGAGVVDRERQKIGLMLAFFHRPELLILDEATSGLDPLMQRRFERLVREAASEGRTVFLSSHDLDEVQRVADRVAIIRDGRLVVTDTVDALRRRAPQTIEARFREPVEASLFTSLSGVAGVSVDATRVQLRLSGPLAPVLRVLADADPIDLTARRANLDELFLDYYDTAGPHGPDER
jgi:ABC-2 type transport system ATP-binding protein